MIPHAPRRFVNIQRMTCTTPWIALVGEPETSTLRLLIFVVALEPTAAICAAALSSNSSPENHYSSLLQVEKFPREDVNSRSTILYTSFGESFTKRGKHVPADPEEYEFGKKFWALANDLFAEGKIKTHATDVRSGGLDAINNGYAPLW